MEVKIIFSGIQTQKYLFNVMTGDIVRIFLVFKKIELCVCFLLHCLSLLGHIDRLYN